MALSGLEQDAEAEKELLAAHEGLRARWERIPLPGRSIVGDTAGNVVEFYETCGNNEQAEQWRRKQKAEMQRNQAERKTAFPT
jgi:hypothetical protein